MKDEIEHVQMDFCYSDTLNASHPDAYERVLVDAIRDDKTLFATSKEVLSSWRIVEPILHAWEIDNTQLLTYRGGSWGPAAADKLANDAGQPWLTDTLNICSIQPKKEVKNG